MIILRYFTLVGDLLPHLKIVKIAVTLLFITMCGINSAQTASVEETKKQANKLFEEEEYTQAYKLFSQLVSNFPKDPDLNYKLGVCMIYSEADKKKCLPFLQFAYSKPDDAPKETKFFLGKAYHINYRFDEAIKYYNEYKKIGSSGNQKKLQVEREIRACGYGKRLLSNLSDLVVLSKKQLNEADYFRSYDLKNIGGKILAKPEEFKTGPDKRKKDKSVVFLPKTGDRVYFSSYGDNTDDGRDIYFRVKLPNGEYSKPEKVKGINTEFDEDFPFLHPNGNVLYFASKGHNSMGGYDIFKSNYIKETDSWTLPQNLEFPINSPDDDYLYVTDSLEKTAYFSTGRQSPPGKIDVLRVNTERKPIDIMALKGTVVKENAEQSLKSKVTVKNIASGEIVGTYNAQDNGDYFMDLPNGAKLLYTVETPGLETQSQGVNLPLVTTSKPFKQVISYDKGILKIINYFDEATSDDSYLQYLKIIENKAKLDVNEGKNNLSPTLIENSVATGTNTTSTSENTNKNPTVTDGGTNTAATNTNSIATNTKTNLSNKELSNIAKQDADESKKEALQLNQDANDAFEIGNSKKIEAENKINEGDEALKNAQAITNEDEKKSAIEKAMAIKTEGENDKVVAEKILNYAKTLDDDAKVKIKEADLNKQYADELEKVIANKNSSKESLSKLDDLQKQINELANQKNKSDDVYNSIKTNVEEKEKQITAIETSNNSVKQNLQEIKTEVANNEEELAKAKKKNKPIIEEKLKELKAEQIDKEKQIADNDSKIKILKDELNALNDELALANKIKTEKIAATNTNTAISSNNNINNNNSTAINTNTISNNSPQKSIVAETLKDKYKDKIAITDNTNKESINQSTTELKNFNKDIDVAVAKDKSNLTKAKTEAEKTKITTEIKNLEDLKRQNQQQIIANNNLAISLNNAISSNSQSNTPQINQNLNPVSTTNNNDAINQLDKLSVSLNNSDVQNFDFNSYLNANAQQLKIQADSKINDAAVEQKKLKETIAVAKDALSKLNGKTSSTNASSQTPEQLSKEAEELASQSLQKLDEAKTKDGAEKEKLLNESKELQNKSNEKNLQATDVTKNDNKATFDTNKENIQTLITENKSNEADNTEAKKLSEEAVLAYNQAKSIREEALSQPNIGAKLGGLSNAEEKEAEALNKQKQAIDLLKKSNSTANLKTAVTSVSSSNNNASTTNNTSDTQAELTQKLNDVNKNIEVLADTKLAAYQKLYEANKAELEQITTNLKNNESAINSTPALKSEYISGTSKITTSETLKQNSDADQNKNDKLTNLINSTKKQIEAITQLNKLYKKVEDQIAKNNNLATNNSSNNNSTTKNSNNNNNTASNNTNNSNNTENPNSNNTTNNSNNNNSSNNSNNSNNNNSVADTNSGNNSTSNNANSTNSNNTNTNSNNTNNSNNTENNNSNNTNSNNSNNSNNTISNVTANTPTIDVNSLSKTDTTATQAVSYFENKNVKLKNPQANAFITNSIKELKKIEDENKQLETANSNATNVSSPSELKAKSDELSQQAEELSVKAFDTKSEANSKTGQEKDDLIAKAKEIENESNTKKIEATNYTQQANESEFKTNSNAISEMLAKLKNDNPNLASVIEQKNNDLTVLKTQANELRNEANNQSNVSAKIGGIGNAEEKEAELLQKQNNLINELKKTYPDYVVKPINAGGTQGNSTALTPEEKTQKQNQLKEKQNTELTNLTNAFSLEYEANKNYIPANLNTKEKEIKQNASDLNAESKRLLIKSTQETNPNEKVKLLTLAAKTGNAAVEQLNLLTGNNATAVNSNPRNNTNTNTTNNNTANNTTNPRNNTNTANNNTRNNNNINNTNNSANPRNNNTTTVANNTNPRNNNTTTTANNNNNNNNTNPRNNNTIANNTANSRNTNNTTGRGTVKIEGLEITAGNAYNAGKPIPVDAKMPDGLVFRVQIGAFKTQLPNDAFKGLSPLNGETAGNGYIRYTAGNFNKLENANAVKNDLRNLGYNDAFVVVYYNGKRIPLNEALALLEKEGKTIDTNAPQSAGITANSNVPKATTVTQTPNVNPQDAVVVTKELEQIKNMLFTVQIGVYSKKVTKQQLQNLKPIYTERLTNGLYRYTAGIYNNGEKIITDKRKVVDLGIKDAFVSAYLDGKRIDFNEARNRQQSDSLVKMESENPIIFTDATTRVDNTNGAVTTNTVNPTNNNAATTNVQPFKNNVTNYPEATPENGIKTSEEGVCFKVQIGAYSKQVPNDVAAKFSAIKNWPIENKQINALFIYNVGNYTEAKFAKDLKEEAIRLGINDAFISVYRDGKKLFGAEAAGLMNR